MILFIAPNPHKLKEREGFMQRVAAIDELFKDEAKLYYEDLATGDKVAAALIEARLIYVHSIYQAKEILHCYPLFAEKIVTDLHGVVPEEEAYAGRPESAQEMAAVEKTVFTYGRTFVAVTQTMADHFTKKYKLTKRTTWIVLPIFDTVPIAHNATAAKTRTVVYAGGAQSWQNVSLMVDTINKRADKYSFTILTHSPEAFAGIAEAVLPHVTLKAVPSSQVSRYYRKASMGFILRDDMIINTVACPTKLIEYLECGVVPIVLSPAIGDFKRLGYAYITLDEFLKSEIDDDALASMAARNLKVLARLERLGERGMAQLRGLSEVLPSKSKVSVTEKFMLAGLVDSARIIAQYKREHTDCHQHLAEYAKSVEHYQRLVETMLQSKRWVLVDVLKKPWTVRRLFSRK